MSYTSSFIVHHIVDNIERMVLIGDVVEGLVSQGDKLKLTNAAGDLVEVTVLAMELDTESSQEVEYFRLFVSDDEFPKTWNIDELIGKNFEIINFDTEA